MKAIGTVPLRRMLLWGCPKNEFAGNAPEVKFATDDETVLPEGSPGASGNRER